MRTREERIEYQKKYNEEHKDRLREWQKKHREKNKEKRSQYQRDYYLKNKERRQQYKKEYYQKMKGNMKNDRLGTDIGESEQEGENGISNS
jgi:DNA repair photolyase